MNVSIIAVLTSAIMMGLVGGYALADDDYTCPPISSSLMQLTIAEKPAYKLGAPVRMTYAIQNQTSKDITCSFSSGKNFDIWITRAGKEVFRASRGMFYTQALTKFTLKPCEKKTFCASWDQKDFRGKQVGPGAYKVYAQLTTSKNQPPLSTSYVQIGSAGVSVLPVTVHLATTMFEEIKNWTVSISGVYRGWKPDPTDTNTSPGPPVTRSDWAVCDTTGCIYVNGTINLDPDEDVGKKVTITGQLQRTAGGQVYLVLKTATIAKP